MKKKTLDESVGVEHFNKKIFDQSMSLVTKCKKIPISMISAPSSEFKTPEVREQYNKLENKLNSIFKLLGKFVQAEKPTYGNSIDFGVEILEECKVLIQTQIKRNQEQRNTVRRATVAPKHKNTRPQQIYENIGPYHNFQKHEHRYFIEQAVIPPIQPYQGQPIIYQFESLKDCKTEAQYVNTPEKLHNCIQELKNVRQIAVDVEHSGKSYQGFTCLIQISSRNKDYLIDVFPIWKQIPKLNQIIGNPEIIKVMHGADMDTKWLQRDFNLHIVNLFDTHRASRMLGMAKFSYAFLLQHYCKVETDKKYQRADWRQRPLIPEMLLYARMDTHYLLPIFDMMRIDLSKQAKQMNLNINSILKEIQTSSHEVTLNEAELFSYKSREMYQLLEEQFRRKNSNYFKVIDRIFWGINTVAYEQDQNFDEILTKKSIIEAISFIKDLIYNKKSKVTKKVRVDRVLSALKNNQGPYVNQIIEIVKPELERAFLLNEGIKKSQEDEDLGEKIESNKAAISKMIKETRKLAISQKKTQIYQQKYERTKVADISLREYQPIHFTPVSSMKNNSVQFGNIMNFMSNKYSIPVKSSQQEQMEEDIAIENSQESEEVDNLQEKPNVADEEQEIIQFKRMNPNVIYVLQEDDKEKQKEVDEAMKRKEPRKKRNEYEYEKRLRNKEGNIYELLE